VLDQLLDDGRLEIEGVSGASAGAVNAVMLADGLARGGADEARQRLADFWRAVSVDGHLPDLQRSVVERLFPFVPREGLWFGAMSRMLSPYDLNPLNINPLKDVIDRFVDFEAIRDNRELELFVSATNVHTGELRIFNRAEVTPEVVMASAALPLLFRAVEIDGTPYWDGGYSGNPAVIPFLRTTTGMIAASNLVAAGAPIALIILAHRQGISAFAIGVFVAIQGVALLLGSTLSPLLRRRFPMRAILLSEFWMALIYVAFLVYPSVYVLAVCVSLHAFWFPNTDSAIQAYSYMLIPDRLLGRAMAAATTLRAASAPLGPLVAGLLLAHTSPQVAIGVLAAPVVIAAIVGTLSDSIRNLPSLEASPAAVG